NLNDAMLYELSKDPGEIVSITEKESKVESTNSNELYPTLMPTSDFVMTVVAQRISERSGDNFKFTATGDWKASPTWEFTDSIALGWSDNFTLYSDYSYMYGYDVNGAQTLYPGTRNSVKAETGVGHNVSLRPGITDDKAVLVAKVYKNASSGTANVVAEYGHVQLTASVTGISFGAGGGSAPTIGFSVDWNSKIEEAVPAYDDFSY
ncbi:hypothetical protein, partial [Gottfriedia acidiceleris]|uniref:hypothetical protein n=1 Tax=Gottfriedia acidiceleris TaxID=371036 RepID=UPI002FFE2F41